MPIKSESATPPPRIGKIGPYTVFVTPPSTPDGPFNPESSNKPAPVPFPVHSLVRKPVQLSSPPPVMAPPAQPCIKEASSFAFFWDAVAKVQNAHASLDEHVAHWFGLNQSKYQWALDDYYESNGKVKIVSSLPNRKEILELDMCMQSEDYRRMRQKPKPTKYRMHKCVTCLGPQFSALTAMDYNTSRNSSFYQREEVKAVLIIL